jgi:glycerophosphoryl diester phosphodiesterase
LLLTRRGQFVAIHDEQVIDSDRDEMTLIARVLARIGNAEMAATAESPFNTSRLFIRRPFEVM